MPSENVLRPRRGMMLALVSPSGAGKSTLARRLTSEDGGFDFSVSWTTRAPRIGEIDGTHYHFVTKDEFRDQRSQDGFLEWAQVHDNYYGSPRASAMETLGNGRDLLFDIDWQGAQQLSASAHDDVVAVFIMPPSMRELRRRLEGRGTDSAEVISKRMTNAYGEISRWGTYDYVLVNDDLERIYADLVAIVRAERLRRARQPWLSGFVAGLLKENSKGE